ncbi:MAG TPA: hypothetical protein VGL75_01005 [Acidothermaceae bacterium]
MGTESAILNQAKKGQGETNERLDRIASAIEAQNELLRQLLPASS